MIAPIAILALISIACAYIIGYSKAMKDSDVKERLEDKYDDGYLQGFRDAMCINQRKKHDL